MKRARDDISFAKRPRESCRRREEQSETRSARVVRVQDGEERFKRRLRLLVRQRHRFLQSAADKHELLRVQPESSKHSVSLARRRRSLINRPRARVFVASSRNHSAPTLHVRPLWSRLSKPQTQSRRAVDGRSAVYVSHKFNARTTHTRTHAHAHTHVHAHTRTHTHEAAASSDRETPASLYVEQRVRKGPVPSHSRDDAGARPQPSVLRLNEVQSFPTAACGTARRRRSVDETRDRFDTHTRKTHG